MKKIVYVFDDINYISGARTVMELQMQLLSRDFSISAFSMTEPTSSTVQRLQGISVEGSHLWKQTKSFALSFTQVWNSKAYSRMEKWKRLTYTIGRRFKKQGQFLPTSLNQMIADVLEPFDVVCVVSEASALRGVAATLHHPKKIQWIHTDYALWRQYSDWTKKISSADRSLYRNYDNIITLSKSNYEGFIKLYPEFQEKTLVIPNVIPVTQIQEKSADSFDRNALGLEKQKKNVITVGRADCEKAYDRILDLCKQLKNEGISFRWHIVGDGPLLSHLKMRVEQEDLSDVVRLYGNLENPYPLMKACDLFALLSTYEGTPVTIPEALVLGIPVVATDVGGVAEQLAYGKYGVVVENRDEEIYDVVKNLLMDEKMLEEKKKAVVEYTYSNETAVMALIEIFKN